MISQRGKSTKEISRRDEIWVSKSGLITIAGGKLTGYRKMAEDTVDKAIKLLDLQARETASDVPLPGGDFEGGVEGQVSRLAGHQLEGDTAIRLTRLYGAEAENVLDLDAGPLTDGGHVMSGEMMWAVREDYRPTEVEEIIEPASIIMASELGWSEGRRTEECDSVRKKINHDLELANTVPA